MKIGENQEKLPCLIGLSQKEIQAVLGARGDASMRSKQLAWHLYRRHETNLQAMGDLPQALRDELELCFRTHPLETAVRKQSTDGVDKLLVHRGDNQVFECVLLPYEDRVSCCLSSQVGCPMGCKFCATGLGGFQRNLEVSEIVGQYLMLQQLTERRISHVVFMGMGEPLLNLPNLIKAMRILHDEVGLSYRHITVSTVGIVPQIEKLAEEKLPIHLALSLHSPLDEVRDRLMPVNHRWPVQEVFNAMRDYQQATGRKITLEYLLIRDVTDTPDQAKALAKLIRGVPNVVNLIPFNYVDTEQGFARPTRQAVRQFRQILEQAGVNVSERMERGHDIAAACGQLAGQHTGRILNRASVADLPVAR